MKQKINYIFEIVEGENFGRKTEIGRIKFFLCGLMFWKYRKVRNPFNRKEVMCLINR